MRRTNWRLIGVLLAAVAVMGGSSLIGVGGDCPCHWGELAHLPVTVESGGFDLPSLAFTFNGLYPSMPVTPDSRPTYFRQQGGNWSIFYGCSHCAAPYDDGWVIKTSSDPFKVYYYNPSSAETAAHTGWHTIDGSGPAPTLSGGEPCSCPGITVTPTTGLTTTEAGGTATFTVVLATEPTADVTLPLSSDDTGEGTVSPASLTFTDGDWDTPQTVTVTGVDDPVFDGNVAYTIVTGDPTSTDTDYNDLGADDVDDVSVTNNDDETPSVIVDPTSGLTTTEDGGTATFTVVLDSEPLGTVTIGVESDDATEGTAAPATLTFTTGNWDTPQTVTVTGQDDGIGDGDVIYTVVTAAASGGGYDGVDPADVLVTNVDNEVSIIVSTISNSTTEAGGTATFTLTPDPAAPTDPVTIPLSSSDVTEGTVPASVVLPAGSTDPVTVTVTGVDDDVNDGDVGYTIVTGDPASGDPKYDVLGASDVADVSVTNTNDDIPGITVTPTSGLTTTEAGGTATFTVVLDTQPNLYAKSPGTSKAWAGVTIDLSSSNPAEGTVDPATLVFTEENWDEPQTVTVTGVDDAVLDGDIGYTIVTEPAIGGDYTGLNAADVSVANLDDEVAIVIVPTGEAGPEAFLDVVLPLGEGETPPMAGDEPLVATHVVGDLITGSCQFLGPSGNPTADGYIHLYLYSVDIASTPDALELIAHWTADFNWTTFEFEFAYDTSGFTPGYYDLRLSFPDGTSETFRVEVTPAV